MKNIAFNILSTLLLIFVLWIFISWVNVMMHNEPDDMSEPADWNLFKIITEVER